MSSDLHLTDPRDSLKMLRETLCVAQSAISHGACRSRSPEHVDRLGRIIAEIDRQRPLGVDGTHGDLHTQTCGCEDTTARRFHTFTGPPAVVYVDEDIPGVGRVVGVIDRDPQYRVDLSPPQDVAEAS